MDTLPDGSLSFAAGTDTFIFAKDNYERHCQKREALKCDWFLEAVEKTLQDPDVITAKKPELIKNSADKRKKTYYRVLKQISAQFISVCQVPVTMAKPKSFINTAIDFYGPPWTVVNTRVEIITWQKPNSLII